MLFDKIILPCRARRGARFGNACVQPHRRTARPSKSSFQHGRPHSLLVMAPPPPFVLDKIPRSCWNGLYSLLAVHEYNIDDGLAVGALAALGDAIAAAAREAEANLNPITDLHKSLAMEAEVAAWHLRRGHSIPTPRAAELFLLFAERPEDADVVKIEDVARVILLPGREDEPEYIVMVPGPLRDAVRALSPHRNPDPEAPLPVQ